MIKFPFNFLPKSISFQISLQVLKFPFGRKFPSKWKRWPGIIEVLHNALKLQKCKQSVYTLRTCAEATVFVCLGNSLYFAVIATSLCKRAFVLTAMLL